MDSSRWQEVQSLFHGAAELPDAERDAYLRSSCRDESVISDVLALLQEDARSSSLLDHDIAGIAEEVLEPAEIPSGAQGFGRYRIKAKLGQGGMGVVYLAEREDLGSLVAVKILRDAWLSPARRERFTAEQRTLAQLVHPLIARLYDADTSPDGTPFFVMEYVKGTPLTEYCDRQKLSIRGRLLLFRTVCEAVIYAHQHAVIHRDLKPSNILVKDDGTIRLLDFGVAKHLENLEDLVDQTITGLRLVTPAYAAPEQIRGEQVGIRTDVYSLGVILYELLAGSLPFDLSGLSPAQVEKVLTDRDAERPSITLSGRKPKASAGTTGLIVSKSAWADLDVTCLTAMHKDPLRRYQSVEALVRDIDHYLKGEPLEARGDTRLYRLRKFIARNQAYVSAAGAAFLIVVVLVVFFTLRLTRERDYANRQTAIATSINQFLADDLLGRGNPFQSGKAAETLLDAIKEASPSIDLKFRNEPQTAARLHLTIAQALDNRSDFADARREYQAAYRLFLQTGGELSQDAIAVELQRASMEARSYQSDALPTAKSIVAAQESLISRIKYPREDLAVWLATAKGMIALVDGNAKAANQYFKTASDVASSLPEFDDIARFNLRQRLAFTYIRLGDGPTAERLTRELITAYSSTNGPDSPYVLRVRLNLAQAYMIQKKFAEAVHEANAVYPAFLEKFGPDHQLTEQLLATRAQSEGSLGDFDASVRDDLAIYDIAVKKQGPLSFYSIATLSDASVGQCRAGHLDEGLKNARKAHDDSSKAFGPTAALTEGSALSLADCLIGVGKFNEASQYLDTIDAKNVAQLTGDPDWGANVTLSRAEIAVRQGQFGKAKEYLDTVRPIFSRPEAEAYQKRRLDQLSALITNKEPAG